MDAVLPFLAFVGALGIGAAIVEGLWPRLQVLWFRCVGERDEFTSERGL